MASFRGSYVHVLDMKGRLALASPIRRITGVKDRDGSEPYLVLSQGLNGCVWAFMEEDWQGYESTLRARQFRDQQSRDVALLLAAGVTNVPIDSAGRILLPQKHIEMAALERGREVLVIGLCDHLELWNPERYAAHFAKSQTVLETNSWDMLRKEKE